jgi:hypothetical protein
VREKRRLLYGPAPARSTASASPTVSVATRAEWPEVVGSRCSIAVTAAVTKPSKSRSISSYRRLFSIATPACEASALTISTLQLSYGTTSRSTMSSAVRRTSAERFRLISWRTPITSSRCDRIGITSIDLVRYPNFSSKLRLSWYGASASSR